MTTEYIIELSFKALPYLVYNAQLRQTISYKELANHIGKHHRVIPHVLGYIRDEICIARRLPLLNAIVVNKQTKLPGESFLPEGTKHLSKEEYLQKYEELRDQVFKFAEWNDLLKEYGLTPIKKKQKDFDKEGREYSNMLERHREIKESKEHLFLKKFIYKNPQEIGIQRDTHGCTEYAFISGDKCDVVFSWKGDNNAVVEVKVGERGELVKGIYQAIKYRSLLKAEKGHGWDIPVSAHLVAYNIPKDIESFAEKFSIKCSILDKKKVFNFCS